MLEILEQGGGWKGYFGVPILRHLEKELGVADRYAGTSVGAINTALACLGKHDEAEEFWDGISDSFPLDGIKGYLNLALSGGGMFSMAPIRKKLDKHVTCAALRRPLRVGVTRKSPFEYKELSVEAAPTIEIGRDWIQASAAIAFIMQPVDTTVNGIPWSARDGGHWQTLPSAHSLSTVVHAILHHPLDLSAELPAPRRNKLVEELEWLLWTGFHAGHARDLAALANLSRRGVEVNVWAPLRPLGGTLDSDKSTLDMRRAEGEAAALRGPVRL